MTTASTNTGSALEQDTVRLCQDLIRFDTTNHGEGRGNEEHAAAYVMSVLEAAGYVPQRYESQPGRTTVVVRVEGSDPGAPALCVHGHLDVVPAQPEEWSVPPFSGELRDGCVWGRGAVDMKDMDAMILACLLEFARSGTKPRRPLLVIFFADEEAGGELGSHWLVDNHPELFDGVTDAISEVGGYSVTLARQAGDRRLYLIQTAEKGIRWLRVTAHGAPGHGSLPVQDSAIGKLVAAMARLSEHIWPQHQIASVKDLLDGVAAMTGSTADDLPQLVRQLGPAGAFVGATLSNTANVTMLDAGYKQNVVPGTASAHIDARFLPGHEAELTDTLEKLLGPDLEVEVLHRDIALESEFDSDLVATMIAALHSEDPDAAVLPYCLSGGTDNKALARLGIVGYGFAPLQLPADLPFAGMFHGIDERVPVESLHFGARVLLRFLVTA